MRHSNYWEIMALALVLACTPSPTHNRDDRAMIDSLFIPFSAPGMPGASVLVVRNDSVIVRASYGLADVASARPNTPETNFRLASLSKQFTAMATLLLVADGKLALQDAAARYLPELPAYATGVRVQHLLSHTSGLPDYEDFVPETQTTQVHDADVLALMSTEAKGLRFAPGSAWHYSNTGYALLALIVERLSGRRYGDFLKARVFDIVGMTNTVAHEEGRTVVARRAYGHTVSQGSVQRTDQSNTSAVLGDGGIYSSIDDLAKWDAALTRGDLIPATLWSEATTPFLLGTGQATEYGYGWFIDSFAGETRMRHHGETRGFTNSIYRFPRRHLTIVILTNRSDSAPWELTDRIATRFLGPP